MWGSFAKKVTGKAGHVIAQRERLRNEYDKSTTPRHATGILHEIESSFQKKGYFGDSVDDEAKDEATATNLGTRVE
jgi:lysozyme family protein